MRNKYVDVCIWSLAFWFLVEATGYVYAKEVTADSPGPGTFTVPDNVREITVEVWGGGGAGGEITSRGATGGGGGGAYARSVVAVESGNLVNYMVGRGGAPGQIASDSWVSLGGNDFARAEPGASVFSNSSMGGSGGRISASTGNQAAVRGGAGAAGAPVGGAPVGGGGGSSAGIFGPGNNASGNSGASGPNGAGDGGDGNESTILGQGSGDEGESPGGGGGGSTTFLAILSGNYSGGAGGNGQVTITYKYSPFPGPPVDNLIVYSGAAITMGASSIVSGNIQVNAAATLGASSIVGGYIVAGAAATLGATVNVDGYIEARDAGTVGANSTIGGHLTTGDAATLGANTIDGNIMVDGDLTAGAAILVGTKAVIAGNLRSGAAASADLGADAMVGGNATAGTALTLGADVIVDGHVQAGTGALMLGVDAMVAGNARAGTSVTLAAGASVGGNITQGSIEQFTNPPKKPVDDQSPQFRQVQTKLAAMLAPASNQLPTSMTVSTTLEAGVYHTTALTTTAGITLTFDGQGVEDHWLINSDTFIAFGASTKIVLKDVTPDSTITWNAGGYIDAGASSNLIGTFFAGSYILTGESTALKGAGRSCGGLFATTGAVTLGASNTIGAVDCTAPSTAEIDHFQILHDGQGLACEPETVTINACANAYDGSCTLSDETVTLDVKATGSGLVTERISFTGTGTARIPYTRAESVILSLGNASIAAINPTVCFNGRKISCDLVFAESGFSLTISNHISGQEVQATILAVKAGEDTPGQCVPAFTVEKDIEFTTVYQNPATGTLAAESGGNVLNGYSLTLDFDGSGAASFPVQYKDVGRVLLKARYEGAGEDAGLVMLGEGTFVARPHRFQVVVPGNPGVLDLSKTGKFKIAGDSFNVEVRSLNFLGQLTPNFGMESPGRESVVLNVASASVPNLPNLPDLQGALELFGESCPTPAGGKACGEFSWPEVGAFALKPSLVDGSYLGTDNVEGENVPYVGRFWPAWFDFFIDQGAFSSVPMSADRTVCTTARNWVYTGEPFGWDIPAEIRISPKNKSGRTLKNYAGTAFQQLSIAGIELSLFPVPDAVQKGVDETLMKLYVVGGRRSAGELRRDPLPAEPAQEGDLLYTFASNDEFFYEKSRNTRVSPFEPAPEFVLERIEDEDFVTADNPDDAFPEKFMPNVPFEIRYGRMALENSYGPENVGLAIPLKAEVFDDNGFELHEDESCWFYNLPENTTVNYDSSALESGQTEVVEITESELTLTDGEPDITPKDYRLRLSAPEPTESEDPQAQGLYVELNVGNDWLKDYWDADNPDNRVDPYAWVTFGVYRGNDRVIYWREVFNN
jgi:hypothetical protein